MISDKFLVIEGLDGAGKSTQVERFRSHLESKGIKSKFLHFPRFDTPIYGDLIARFLRGDFGSIDSVDPYIVALLYAQDRAEASEMIKGWIEEGYFVVADRYLYSNIAYQCAKVEEKEKRKELRDWIFDLEYNHNNIIRPAKSIFLDVPFKFTKKSLSNQRNGDDRDYLKGKEDIHESSLVFQQKVREVYLDQEQYDTSFSVVSCADVNGNMLPIEQIFNKIIEITSL